MKALGLAAQCSANATLRRVTRVWTCAKDRTKICKRRLDILKYLLMIVLALQSTLVEVLMVFAVTLHFGGESAALMCCYGSTI